MKDNLRYSIVKPSQTDLINQLVALINASYAAQGTGRSWTSEEGYFDGTRTSFSQIKEHVERVSGVMLAVFDEDNLVANVFVEVIDEEGYVGMLTVDPFQQDKGFGKRVLIFAEEYLRSKGVACIKMKVIKERKELISWYLRQGYSDTGKEVKFLVVDKTIGKPLKPLYFNVLCKVL